MFEDFELCQEKIQLRSEFVQRLDEFNIGTRAWLTGRISRKALMAQLDATREAWDRYLAHVDGHGCRYGTEAPSGPVSLGQSIHGVM